MYLLQVIILSALCTFISSEKIFESDVNVRIDAGTRLCLFEKGKSDQVMEFYYHVLDGQHGELDISVNVFDPKGTKIIAEHKKTYNSIIMELEHTGDYVFCFDNSHSVMNSKLVYFYVLMENKENEEHTTVTVVEDDGQEKEEEEIVEWIGIDTEGEKYSIEVTKIIDSVVHMLNLVVRARRLLDIYGATKTRDSYMAVEDTFIVDVWSTFQIIFMLCVGMLQVYMIKRLFNPQCKI